MTAATPALLNFSPVQAYVPSGKAEVKYSLPPFDLNASTAAQVDSPAAAEQPVAAPASAANADPDSDPMTPAAKRKILQRFVIEPTKFAKDMLANSFAAIWRNIVKVIKKIAQFLGIPVTIKQETNGEGQTSSIAVEANATPKEMEGMRNSAEIVANSEIGKQVISEAQEPLLTIKNMNIMFDDLQSSITKFESDWAASHPELPLSDALKTLAVPAIQTYRDAIQDAKTLVFNASLIYDANPSHVDSFSPALREAIESQKRDLQSRDAESLSHAELSTQYDEATKFLREFKNKWEKSNPGKNFLNERKLKRIDNIDLYNSVETKKNRIFLAAANIYQNQPQNRSKLSDDLLHAIQMQFGEEFKSMAPSNLQLQSQKDTSGESISVQNGNKSSKMNSVGLQSTNSINEIVGNSKENEPEGSGANVVLLSRRTEKGAVAYDAAAHLPGVGSSSSSATKPAETVLPTFHNDSPRNDGAGRFNFGKVKVVEAAPDSDHEFGDFAAEQPVRPTEKQ
jgi:hypothetical protein